MTENVSEASVPVSAPLDVAREILSACAEAKGKDIAVLDVTKVFDLANYFIVVSGRSDRHVQGIANKVNAELERLGIVPVSIEGYEDGHWILVDYGDVIMHIFYEPVRSHYDIEGLWARARKLDLKKLGVVEVRDAA